MIHFSPSPPPSSLASRDLCPHPHPSILTVQATCDDREYITAACHADAEGEIEKERERELHTKR